MSESELEKAKNQMLAAIRKHLPHEWEKLKKEFPRDWEAWEWEMDNPVKN